MKLAIVKRNLKTKNKSKITEAIEKKTKSKLELETRKRKLVREKNNSKVTAVPIEKTENKETTVDRKTEKESKNAPKPRRYLLRRQAK